MYQCMLNFIFHTEIAEIFFVVNCGPLSQTTSSGNLKLAKVESIVVLALAKCIRQWRI